MNFEVYHTHPDSYRDTPDTDFTRELRRFQDYFLH